MGTNTKRTTPLGELIVTAFDRAAGDSSDPQDISHRATTAVRLALEGARWRTNAPARMLADVILRYPT